MSKQQLDMFAQPKPTKAEKNQAKRDARLAAERQIFHKALSRSSVTLTEVKAEVGAARTRDLGFPGLDGPMMDLIERIAPPLDERYIACCRHLQTVVCDRSAPI